MKKMEIDVANFLRDNDYHVDYQISEGGFLIDLGVKKKKEDSHYLCGVECDGRTWHSGWRARHNGIWRQKILEDKGWKIVRIWSDKWYNAPEAERGKELLEEIRAIEQNLMQTMEIDVANFLRDNDYYVDYQISEGGFLIDLGVKKKKEDSHYLCGVECDGRTWHSGWRARHNDIWRQGILKDKGWEIVRIWNDEWYDTEEGGKKLLDKIRAVEQKLTQKMSIK